MRVRTITLAGDIEFGEIASGAVSADGIVRVVIGLPGQACNDPSAEAARADFADTNSSKRTGATDAHVALGGVLRAGEHVLGLHDIGQGGAVDDGLPVNVIHQVIGDVKRLKVGQVGDNAWAQLPNFVAGEIDVDNFG